MKPKPNKKEKAQMEEIEEVPVNNDAAFDVVAE